MTKLCILSVVACFVIFVAGDEYHQKKTLFVSSLKAKSFPLNPIVNEMESSKEFWREKAQNYLISKLTEKMNTNKAKNIIFFIGDGMSLPTVAATRMYMGKEENELSFEKFPHFGFSHTYCVDKQVADSACSATAYLGGVKTNYKTIGVNANVKVSQCDVNEDDHVKSIAKWAQDSNKATGIVTTTRVTHASPAGVYAHTSHRDWENNNEIPAACKNLENIEVRDIADQLINNQVAKNLKVILGGGRRNFINTTELDDEGRPGLRTDGRNLIDEWLNERSKTATAKYVWHKQQLDEIDVEKTDFLLGLFESDHCMYNLDILNNNLQHQEPSLTDMTVKAIKMLQKEENGFFLFVEGGRIDMAHHENRPQKAMEDTKEFARAIDVARKMTNEEDTLIVVSSDHSHAFSYNGYTDRGDDILGIAEISDEDNKPYETLSYANGPGYRSTYNGVELERVDITSQDLKNPERRASATVPLSSETHAGEDVGVYASGPWSHLFVGSYEQNNLPLMMAYAAQIGEYRTELDSTETTTTDSASLKSVSLIIFILVSLTITFL
jgi:alkaline phosphatase